MFLSNVRIECSYRVTNRMILSNDPIDCSCRMFLSNVSIECSIECVYRMFHRMFLSNVPSNVLIECSYRMFDRMFLPNVFIECSYRMFDRMFLPNVFIECSDRIFDRMFLSNVSSGHRHIAGSPFTVAVEPHANDPSGAKPGWVVAHGSGTAWTEVGMLYSKVLLERSIE